MATPEMASAGAEMDSGGPETKPQLVCPQCGATFEQVQTEGGGDGGGEDKSWEDELRHMTARTPENEGQAQ